MTVRGMLASMDAAEFVEWMAFQRLEPFGDMQADFRAGQVCATLANLQRKKDAKPFAAADFMPALRPPEDDEPEVELTDEQRAAFLDAAFFGVAPTTLQ